MCRIASLFLLQRLKESMSGDACDFNNTETRTVIQFSHTLSLSLFLPPLSLLQGKVPTVIYTILTKML
jgi:hypothetical protein